MKSEEQRDDEILGLDSEINNSANNADEEESTEDDGGEDQDEDEELSGDDEADEDSEDTTYSIDHGNTGLVLVNQVVDYLNRGDQLSEMNLYDYVASIYKVKLTADEERKLSILEGENKNNGRGRKLQNRYRFGDSHPQSKTHLQRARGSTSIPILSYFPATQQYDPEKFYKCMLCLFKPFASFIDLYNGISWEDSYVSHDFGPNIGYMKNMEEMNKGLDERNGDREKNAGEPDENGDDNYACPLDEDDYDGEDNLEAFLDKENCPEIIDKLKESLTNNSTPSYGNFPSLPQPVLRKKVWKKEMDNHAAQFKQMNNFGEEGIDCYIHDSDSDTNNNYNLSSSQDIDFHIDTVDAVNWEEILNDTINKFTLNPKQTVVFRLMTENTLKRLTGKPTKQVMAFIGGAGGTGKSQVINATKEFFTMVHLRHKLRLSAFTGIAANLIAFGGLVVSLGPKI